MYQIIIFNYFDGNRSVQDQANQWLYENKDITIHSYTYKNGGGDSIDEVLTILYKKK